MWAAAIPAAMKMFGDTKDEQQAKMTGMGSLIGGLWGQHNAIDPGAVTNPYFTQANKYLEQTPGYVQQYLDPYVNAGQGAMRTLQNQYQNLLNDPNALLAKLGAGYQQSPGYQRNVDEATRASNNAAAAGGYIGSPQQQEQMAKSISGIASQDYNQYLNNVMGLYGQGLQGMGGINQMGYGAAGGATSTLADMLKNQAQNAQTQAEMNYYNTMNQNQKSEQQSSGLGGLIGGIFNGLSSIF